MYQPSSNLCVRACVVCRRVGVRLEYILGYFLSVPQLNSLEVTRSMQLYTDKTHFVRRHDCVCGCVLFMSVCCCFLLFFFARHMGSHTPSSEDLAPISVERIMSGKVWLAFCKETRLRVKPCFVHVSVLFCFHCPTTWAAAHRLRGI